MMMEYINCNICGSDDFTELYRENIDYTKIPDEQEFRCSSVNHGRHGRIVKCKDCGLVFVNPRRNAHIIQKLYQDQEDKIYYEERRGRIATFSKALGNINSRYDQRDKLLDVGCGIGLFLRLARASGWIVKGVEPSKWASQIAKEKYKLGVHNGTLTSANFKDEEFDVVTMWDVIEHCIDPLEELKHINRILKKNHYLYLTTIDLGGRIARIMGRHWWWFMEMHLFYFTKETIEKLLDEAGFKVISITKHCRYVTLSYLVSRMNHLSKSLANMLQIILKKSNFYQNVVKISLGDIMTVVACKR